ncbi:MAG: alkane 1-monooxygenase [Pseudonocardiales bacterium]|nr:alkane 1-monooxygenase [Pseudonocardiales bacterium]
MSSTATEALRTPSWTDRKRYLWLLSMIVPLVPVAGWGLVNATGLRLFWWFGPMFIYILMPLADVLLGRDSENPPESALAWLEQDKYYRWCTYLFLPLQYASMVCACRLWSRSDLAVVDKIGLAATMGMVSGIAINTAHELGHKKEHAERWFAKIALAPVLYGHFFIEHNRGHHVRVATPEDPASSRLGESFWQFLPRTMIGSLRSGWALEARRLRRLDRTRFSLRNDILNAWLMSVVLFAALAVAFGPSVLPYLLGQAVLGMTLLEVVNYLEHYGLLRRTATNGRFEHVQARHSWNSNNIASNVFLYHLQRHSDHHANPTRRYQALRDTDGAPQLPAGYAAMIVLAYCTPLWRRVMDAKVVAHYDGDYTSANVQPGAAKRLNRRFGRPVSADQRRSVA